MIIPQARFDAIRNPRIRSRLLYLPVRYGKFGERKKCPMRSGGVYHLKPPVPYELLCAQANEQPHRPRAVLWLIDRCMELTASVTITVRDTPEIQTIDGQRTWVIRFAKGDQASTLDQPVLLAKHGDYTTRRDQAVRGEPEVLMPLAADLAKARARALERRVSPEAEALGRCVRDADTLQHSMANMKARTLVKRAQRNYEAAMRLLLSGHMLDSSVVAASDGSQGEEDRPPSASSLATPEAT